MIKQRYIRHQAINKQGEVVATGVEIAKQIYPFLGDFKVSSLHTVSTAGFMAGKFHIGSLQKWKEILSERGPVRFTKAIVYVG